MSAAFDDAGNARCKTTSNRLGLGSARRRDSSPQLLQNLFGRHHPSKEHVNGLERRYVHAVIETGVAVAREDHAVVAKERGPSRRLAANVGRGPDDDHGVDGLIAKYRIEIRLKKG